MLSPPAVPPPPPLLWGPGSVLGCSKPLALAVQGPRSGSLVRQGTWPRGPGCREVGTLGCTWILGSHPCRRLSAGCPQSLRPWWRRRGGGSCVVHLPLPSPLIGDGRPRGGRGALGLQGAGPRPVPPREASAHLPAPPAPQSAATLVPPQHLPHVAGSSPPAEQGLSSLGLPVPLPSPNSGRFPLWVPTAAPPLAWPRPHPAPQALCVWRGPQPGLHWTPGWQQAACVRALPLHPASTGWPQRWVPQAPPRRCLSWGRTGRRQGPSWASQTSVPARVRSREREVAGVAAWHGALG